MQTTLLGEKHWIFFGMLDASELVFEEEMDNIWCEVI